MGITIIAYPNIAAQGSYYKLISNFLKITEGLPRTLYSNVERTPAELLRAVKTVNVPYPDSKSTVSTALSFIAMQLRTSWRMLRNRKSIDGPIVIFSGSMVLPFFVGKILRRPVIIPALAPESRGIYYRQGRRTSSVVGMFERACFSLATVIAVEGPSVTGFMGLEGHLDKIFPQGSLFIADGRFDLKVPFSRRPHRVAYIGRFSKEKGIEEFLKAVEGIDARDIEIELVGEGDVSGLIAGPENGPRTGNISAVRPWIDHELLPRYLNEIRYLVLPSYTEGLPNIVMEAMSCGVVVIASPVGAVPDVVIDGATGFLMKNNSPEAIREAMVRAINTDIETLERISSNANRFVFDHFSLQKNKDRWLLLLSMGRVKNDLS